MADILNIEVTLNGLNRSVFCPRYTIFQGPDGGRYSDKYSDASATWVVVASILIFFMKTGFLFVEVAFVSDNHQATRRVILAKYLDTCASAVAFYIFGYAVSGGAGPMTVVLGEEQDFIEWFFKFTFASNTATILHGTLVGEPRKLRMIALFIYAFLISAFIHPFIARMLWSPVGSFSPYRFCNGTLDRESGTFTYTYNFPGPNDNIVFFDFAGSGAVHMLGGFGGLVLALFCKYERYKNDRKYEKDEMNRHAEYQVSDNFTVEESSLATRGKRSSTKRGGSQSGSTKVKETRVEMSDMTHNASALASNTSAAVTQSHGADSSALNMVVETPDPSANANAEPDEDFLDWMYPKDASGEHMEFAALGVLILWMTFFAFNCGTTESISGKVHHAILGRIALNMVVSGCFGGLVGIFIALFAQLRSRSKIINTNEIANCILSALVAITGVCPYIDSQRAIVVGVGAALFYHLGVHAEYRWDIRDTARVFPVHGMCGMWGLLCVGILGQSQLIRQTYENICQCLYIRLPDTVDSQGYVMLYQLAAIAVIMAWSVGSCLFVFLILHFIPMQGFANLIDFAMVDFLDHYIAPALTVIISCSKPGPRRYRRKHQDKRSSEDGSGADAISVDHTQEDLFVFEGGMLLTGACEYGADGMQRRAWGQ